MAVSFVFTLAGLTSGCGGGGGGPTDGVSVVAPIGTSPVDTGEQVSLYRMFQRSITNDGDYTNKFTDVSLDVTYTSPSGREVKFAGFFDGNGAGSQDGNVWKIRFLPDEVGEWTYRYSWSDDTDGGEGKFTAVASGAGLGVLKAYADNPRWFAYNRDEPVFLKSFHVGAAGFTGVPIEWAANQVYSKLKNRGYNHVMLKSLPITWTDEKPADAPADHLARPLWSETPTEQDLEVWQRFEEHLKWLNENDMGVHLFIGFDPKGASSPSQFFASKRWTALSGAQREFYVRYVAARIAPFANVAGWNYTWETDGNTGEQQLMTLLAKYDPWGHLATYHDEAPANNSFNNSRYSFAGIENHGYFGNRGGKPALDSASHYQATLDGYRGKPVYMVEGNALWRACWAGDAAQTAAPRAAWAVTLAGGSFTWQDTAGCFDGAMGSMLNWPAGDSVADRINVLYRVMTSDVTFHQMTPRNDLLSGCASNFNRSGAVPKSPCFALAEVGRQYVVYKEDGGNFSLNLAAGSYQASWIDTRTGGRQPASGGMVQGNGAPIAFTAPTTASDWVLLLKKG